MTATMQRLEDKDADKRAAAVRDLGASAKLVAQHGAAIAQRLEDSNEVVRTVAAEARPEAAFATDLDDSTSAGRALALAVTTQGVFTATATLHFWRFKFGCASAFQSVLDIVQICLVHSGH